MHSDREMGMLSFLMFTFQNDTPRTLRKRYLNVNIGTKDYVAV